MGFNKMYLPEEQELKEFLTKYGKESFHERWVIPFKKRDAIIGPSESIEFIKQFIESEYNNRPGDTLHTGIGQETNK
jgi:hypothetical protein|tara:strand:+ start:1085 stop:1315 length:231 start_codon:yes stop_codon:yes gene_type:complete